MEITERLPHDLRHLTGPFDVVGDVHGCRVELVHLLRELGYEVADDGARHPDGRTAVFVGDLVDRGPDTPGVLRLVMGMVRAGTALCVRGNHDDKPARALKGRDVTVVHGLEKSLAQLAHETGAFRAEVLEFLDSLVPHYVLDGGDLVVAHAGLPSGTTGSSRRGRGRRPCGGRARARSTRAVSRSGTRGSRSTAGPQPSCMDTRRSRNRCGSTERCAWTPVARSAAR